MLEPQEILYFNVDALIISCYILKNLFLRIFYFLCFSMSMILTFIHSGWITSVGQVRYVIHPLLRGVATPEGLQVRATVRPSGHNFSCPLCLFPYSLFSSHLLLSLSYFILAVLMRKCLGKHSCISSTFPTAIFNSTCFVRSAKNSIRSESRVLSNKTLELKLTVYDFNASHAFSFSCLEMWTSKFKCRIVCRTQCLLRV